MRDLALSSDPGVRCLWGPRPTRLLAVTVLVARLLAGGGGATAQPAPPCGGAPAAALATAARRLEQADDAGAAGALRQVSAAGGACPELAVAQLAVDGWIEARRLALVGGDPRELGTVRGMLERLAALSGGRGAAFDGRHAGYAEAVVRAAVAAAQDERDEMQLFLTHARGLSDRLRLGGQRPRWPLAIDEVEGELWLEVDRFAEAREAFRRAPATGRTLMGLARATERIGAPTEACLAWRRAADRELAAPVRDRVDEALSRLRCGPPE